MRRINRKRRPNCNTGTTKIEAKKAEKTEIKAGKAENELHLDGDQWHKLDQLPEKIQKQRFFGMDVVRILALCLLYWLHFFLRNGFYSQPVDNPAMIVAVSGRIFLCVVSRCF